MPTRKPPSRHAAEWWASSSARPENNVEVGREETSETWACSSARPENNLEVGGEGTSETWVPIAGLVQRVTQTTAKQRGG